MPSKLASKFNDIAFGLTLPFRALKTILAHPKLIFLSVLPILLSTFTMGFILFFGLAGVWSLTLQVLSAWIPNYAWIGGTVLTAIASLLIGYALFYATSIIMSLVASPFNDYLAEGTEIAKGEKVPSLGLTQLVRVFLLDLRKTALSLSLLALFTLFSFIPVIGLFSLIGFSLIQTLTFISYPQSRRQHGIREAIQFIRAHFWASLGFGIMTSILFGIPGLNLVALPISVVGGTLLFLKKSA